MLYSYTYYKYKYFIKIVKEKEGGIILCSPGCEGCEPLVDKKPDTSPTVPGFEIELVSCELINPTTREFIYKITPVDGEPPRSISNILLCLCPAGFIDCDVTVNIETVSPKCSFEPKPQGNPIECDWGVKFEDLGENKLEGSEITLFITVDDQDITVEPIQIGYKAGEGEFIWEVCGPICKQQPLDLRKRGISFY